MANRFRFYPVWFVANACASRVGREMRHIRANAPQIVWSLLVFARDAVLNWGFGAMAVIDLIIAITQGVHPEFSLTPMDWAWLVAFSILVGVFVAYHKLRIQFAREPSQSDLEDLRDMKLDVLDQLSRLGDDAKGAATNVGLAIQEAINLGVYEASKYGKLRRRITGAIRRSYDWQDQHNINTDHSVLVVFISVDEQNPERSLYDLSHIEKSIRRLHKGMLVFLQDLDRAIADLEYRLGER